MMHLDDWCYVKDLLKCGYPLLDIFEFLEIDTKELEESLEIGKSIDECLIQHQRGRFYEHLQFFVRITSLYHAIDASIQMLEFERNMKIKFLKQSAYPIFVFVFSYFILIFFIQTIIPQMMDSFQYEQNFTVLLSLMHIFSIFAYGILIGILFILLFVFYLMHHKKQRFHTICFLSRYTSIFADYFSYMFSGYLIAFDKHGIATRSAFLYLKDANKNSIFSYLISDIHKQLEEGNNIIASFQKQVLLSKQFIQSYHVGVLLSNQIDILTAFMEQQEHVWERRVKKACILIQLISYAFVAFLIVIMYQIMIIPLSMLEDM